MNTDFDLEAYKWAKHPAFINAFGRKI